VKTRILATVLCVVFLAELALFNASWAGAVLHEGGMVWEAQVLGMAIVGIVSMITAWWAASRV